MHEAIVTGQVPARSYLPILGLAAALIALLLTAKVLAGYLPPALWLQALWAPDGADVQQLLFHHAAVPRLLVSLLAGAALGLAGALFQLVLRNPLAEPTTLGTAAGAYLALTAATLYAPWLLEGGRTWVTLAGGTVATAAVFALAWGRGLAPIPVITAGLIVSFYCSSVSATLVLLNHEYLSALFIWQSGALGQNGWGTTSWLAPRLLLTAIPVLLLLRPLSVMELDDGAARGLGLSVASTRLVTLGLALVLTALVISAVGVIGFVGLAAPALARLAGARRVRQRLLWSPLLGACLLWLADQLIQALSGASVEVPTGIATAVLGAPLLLYLLRYLPAGAGGRLESSPRPPPRTLSPGLLAAGCVVSLGGLVWLALALGPTHTGWQWSHGQAFVDTLPWRAPRVAAALGAGAMLGIAGVMVQRLTANPLASPEVLGISSGAALGVIVLIVVSPTFSQVAMLGAAAAGAFATLLTMLALGWRSGFSPDRILLAGVALGTLFSALATLVLVSGDPRAELLMRWMTGSTYRVSVRDAGFACALALAGLALAPTFARWLDILPLGPAVSRGFGLNLPLSRLAVLAMVAVLTAAATLIVGPLSFIGLMAPHMVRMLGVSRSLPQVLIAAGLGAGIMVLADWLGRTLVFPWQLPAGLLATFVGGPYLMWLLRRG